LRRPELFRRSPQTAKRRSPEKRLYVAMVNHCDSNPVSPPFKWEFSG
jgi:hypothetical protein